MIRGDRPKNFSERTAWAMKIAAKLYSFAFLKRKFTAFCGYKLAADACAEHSHDPRMILPQPSVGTLLGQFHYSALHASIFDHWRQSIPSITSYGASGWLSYQIEKFGVASDAAKNSSNAFAQYLFTQTSVDFAAA